MSHAERLRQLITWDGSKTQTDASAERHTRIQPQTEQLRAVNKVTVPMKDKHLA